MARPKKIPIPWSRRLEALRHNVFPVAVWLAAVFGVVQLLDLRDQGGEYLGIVETTEYVVSAPVDGVLHELAVGAYDQVEAGQVLATMDPGPLSASIRTATAEIERLASEQRVVTTELDSELASLARDWEKDVRRFQMDAADLRLDLLRERVKLETARFEAERVRVAWDRAVALVEAEVSSEADAEDLELQHKVLIEEIRTTEELVARLEEEFAAATMRSSEFQASAPEQIALEPRLEALRMAVEVQELRLAEIEIARAGLVVRAPVSGQVRELYANLGRTLVLGQDLLAITPTVGAQVVFYQPLSHAAGIAVGTKVEVRQVGDPTVREAIVTSFAPTAGEIPPVLWKDPAIPEFGWAVRLGRLVDAHLVPGFPVFVTPTE